MHNLASEIKVNNSESEVNNSTSEVNYFTSEIKVESNVKKYVMISLLEVGLKGSALEDFTHQDKYRLLSSQS